MKKLILIICLAAAFGPARAQLRLTLDEAVEMALNENPTIRIADMEIERYDYVKKETRGNLLPTLTASGSYTRSIVKSTMRGGISFGADNTFAVQGDLNVPLFVPAVYRTLKLNRAQIEGAVESARSSRIEMVAAVKTAFYNILLAERSLTTLEEAAATARRTVDDTQVQFDNGLAAEYDLITAQVQLSNIEPSLLQTRNSIEVAKLQLKMYLSIPEEVAIEVSGSLEEMQAEADRAAEGLSTDVSRNSSLRSLDIQKEVLQAQLRTTNAARLPSLSAFGQGSYTGNDMKAIFGEADPNEPKYLWTHPISVGVRLSVPIFSGLKNSYKARQVKNQIAQLNLQRDYAERGVELQIRTAINNLLTARETMRAQEKTAEQASKAYDISNTRYKAGAGTILELNSAQLAKTQARLSYSQAVFDYLSAKAEYDRIAGLDPETK